MLHTVSYIHVLPVVIDSIFFYLKLQIEFYLKNSYHMFLMNIPVMCFHQAYMIQVLHQLNQDKAIFLMLYHIAVLLFPLCVLHSILKHSQHTY